MQASGLLFGTSYFQGKTRQPRAKHAQLEQASGQTFTTRIQLHGPNTPIVHPNASSTYVKGASGVGFYCVRVGNVTHKYPMNGIFKVEETGNSTET